MTRRRTMGSPGAICRPSPHSGLHMLRLFLVLSVCFLELSKLVTFDTPFTASW